MTVLRKSLKLSLAFLKWVGLALLLGASGGLLGAGFHHVLHFVTSLRTENPWLIYLLPLGGLISVGLYGLLKLRENRGTNEVLEAALTGNTVKPQVMPGIFLATAITHLFGGSAGREGAALQLGGSAAGMAARLFRLGEQSRKILTAAGMSAVFAGLFGTPLTAAVFCMEFTSVGTLFSPALLPSFLAALTASRISLLLGVQAEGQILDTVYGLSGLNIGRYILLAVLLSLLGIAMCHMFHKAEHLAAHWVKNPYWRIALGGIVIAGLTALVGDHRFNGAGMDMALEAVGGSARWYFFLLKLLFTAVTLSAGFKGGEIVPTFCIGATFGWLAGGLLGMDPSFAAALGLIGLFCSATNTPIASILLSVEMFGSSNILVFALVCAICFVLSGRSSLYSSQRMPFDKLDAGKKCMKSHLKKEELL